ncbi:chromosomal replication initiator DnaA, partial [Kitasatospora sp. NPDC036755]
MADVNSDLVPVWARVVERLVSDPDVGEMDKQWVQRTQPMWMMHDTALLATPNERAKQVLEGRLLPQLTEALSRELSRPVRIAVMVDANAAPTSPAPTPQAPAEPYPGPDEEDGPDYGGQGYQQPYEQGRSYEQGQPYEQGQYEQDYERPRYDTGGYEQRQAPYGGPGGGPGWQGYQEQPPAYRDAEEPAPRPAPRPVPGPPATTQGDLFGGAYGPGPNEQPRTGAGRDDFGVDDNFFDLGGDS